MNASEFTVVQLGAFIFSGAVAYAWLCAMAWLSQFDFADVWKVTRKSIGRLSGKGRVSVDRLAEWLTRYDDEDPDRSRAFGLIAGWWSPGDSHEHKTERLGSLLDPLDPPKGGSGVPATGTEFRGLCNSIEGSIRIALAGEAIEAASLRIDVNPVPQPPLRGTP